MRLIALALAVFVTCCSKQQEPPKKLRFPVETLRPTIKDITPYKTYVGSVRPFVQVEVKAQVSGELLEYCFTEGQQVKAGDLLFKIDSRPYRAQLLKAQGALAQSMASLHHAKDVAKRNKKLVSEDFVSQLQYEQYLTDVLTYEAQVKEQEADVITAKLNIGYCDIHSPIDAIAGRLQVQVGNLVSTASATPLITLNQITPIYTYFSVPQKDLPLIMKLHREKSLKLSAHLENDTKNVHFGVVDLIDNQINEQTGAIWLRGLFPNQDQMLWPGEFCEIRLFLDPIEQATLIPTEAIVNGQKGTHVFVVKEDNTAEIRYVQTGQSIDEMTLIEKGIEPTDRVVIKGQINLGSGTPVVIRKGEHSS